MGGKSATTTSKVSVPPEVLARYNAVNARAETAAAKPFQAYGTTASDYVAPINAQQRAGFSDINATAGSYQPYIDSATTATTAGMGPAFAGIDRYMSPYIKNVADTTGALLKQQYEQAQSGALGNAISSGAFGGDRAGIAAANLQQQNQMGYGKTMADIYNQGYTQALGASQADLARQLQGGAQMAGLGAQSQQLGLQGAQAKIAAGTMEQQTGQAGIDAMINRFMQEQGLPYQQAQFLANIAMGTGAASGSTTSTTSPLGIFGNLATGGRVEGYADGGGVAGPRTYTQSGVGSEGYVPAGDLPVGQLMVANPPDQQKSNGTDQIIKLIAMMGGAKNGGAIDERHGYALDGGVLGPNTQEMLRQREIRDSIPGLALADRRRSESNAAAAMSNQYDLPSNIGLAGHMTPKVIIPNAVSGISALPQSPSPEEQWDVPVRSGMTKPEQPFRSGMREPEIPFRGGMREPAIPFRSGMEKPEQPFRSGPIPFEGSPALGGPGTFATGVLPSQLASMRPQPRPEGLGYQPTMPEGGPDTMPAGMRPQPRPTDLGVAAARYDFPTGLGVAAPVTTGVVTPTADANDVAADTMKTINLEPSAADNSALLEPVTLGTGNISPIDPVAFYQTRVLQQESGRNQLDKNGNPLTSSAGAVGSAQVMEATGPEAAKLAGLPWDRNRWLYDQDYNEAIGQAYFLEQYRKFGSLDKAAAAYNAGPGALASAIDRATALGGSYLDYLPAETQNYVYSTTGTGSPVNGDGVGGGRKASADGLGGANMAQQRDGLPNRDKPYEDRNFLGKFFRNPDGSMNPIALKSVLGGLGAMARSNTISPISALLQGFAGGEDIYNKLQNEEPKRVADILTNSATARLQYETQVALGEKRPFDQWAKAQFGNGAQSMIGGPNGNVAPVDQITGGKSYMGIPLDPTGKGFAMPIQLPDGSGTILASQSYAYNSQLADSVARDAALGIPFAVNTLEIAKANIDAIEANKGKVQTTDGRIIDDPTYTSRMFGANSAASDLVASDKLQQALPTMTQNAQNYRRRTDQLADALSTMPTTGPLAGWASTAGGIITQLGLMPESDAATGYQTAYKTLADEALTTMADLAGTVDTSTLARQIQGSNPTPEMTPRAIEHVLAIRAAVSDYQIAMADYLNKAMADPNNAGKNLAQLQREFAANNDIADFVEQQDKKYAGTIEPIMPADMDPKIWSKMSKEKKRAWIASESQGG